MLLLLSRCWPLGLPRARPACETPCPPVLDQRPQHLQLAPLVLSLSACSSLAAFQVDVCCGEDGVELVKSALAAAVEALPPGARFGLLSFGSQASAAGAGRWGVVWGRGQLACACKDGGLHRPCPGGTLGVTHINGLSSVTAGGPAPAWRRRRPGGPCHPGGSRGRHRQPACALLAGAVAAYWSSGAISECCACPRHGQPLCEQPHFPAMRTQAATRHPPHCVGGGAAGRGPHLSGRLQARHSGRH